jgi:aldehyde:ferredoxin oxidoreductase
LRVDLGSKKITTEDTEKYAKRYIGGRAINNFILLNELAPQTKWSDPENMLIFGVGCLEGTLAPGACRVSIDTINVFNNGKGSANAGGYFGPELKYAGFDHVVITGKAESPVYLWIHDGEAEIRDASSIWGKTTFETEEILQSELGDNKVEIAAIGPAGENLVKGSCIIFDCCKAAGGSGVGCVMGSKRLKAIAVRGHGAIKVAEPERFFSAVNTALQKVKDSPRSQIQRTGNVVGRFNPESPLWTSHCDMIRNGQSGDWPIEKRAKLVGKDTGVPKYMKKMTAGFTCPVGCIPYLEIEEGDYKGTKGRGYWVNSCWWTLMSDIDDPAASLRYHIRANQLGLDGDDSSVVIAWAFECYQRGLLTKEDTDGLELEWGNADAWLKMEEKLAYREGIGDFLADGVKEASRKLGKGSEEFALHMKGQDTVDPYRACKAWGFGVAISPVAGRHLRGAGSKSGVIGPKEGLTYSAEGYENVPELVFWESRAKEIEDITGICNYLGTFTGAFALEPSIHVDRKTWN